jgi:hypothetical protein
MARATLRAKAPLFLWASSSIKVKLIFWDWVKAQ